MAQEASHIPVVIILGSVRPNSYTGMAVALVADEFRKHPEYSVKVIDPASLGLPFPGTVKDSAATQALQADVKAAAGVVLATPEYHGTFSSIMKLVVENLGFPSVLAGKPVALLGVAAGAIGAIKSLEHLRGVCSHVGALVLPIPVSVAYVQKVFDAQGHPLDPGVEKHVRSVAKNLMDYLHQHVCPAITLERVLREGIGVIR